MAWDERAACRDDPDPDAWFASDVDRLRAALVICGTCPVVAQCHDAGDGEDHGVWGGQPRGAAQQVALGLPESVSA